MRNSIELRRLAFQTLSKALDISSATAWVAPDLLKAPAILCNSQKTCSCLRRPETILEIRKKGYISLGDKQAYYLEVFERLY